MSKIYGEKNTAVEALKPCTFTIKSGERVAVVGASGSGKSTLLHLLGALDSPTGGTVTYDGNEIISQKDEKVCLTLNFPLQKGYYLFKKHRGYFLIENLQNGEKLFFNYVCPMANISHSMIDGLDNSCYATILLKLNFVLKAGAERVLYFNLSSKKSPLKNKGQFDKLFETAITKNREIFDLRVKTKNQKFDQYFNNTLPKKIWLNWLDFNNDEVLIEKYTTYRALFIKGKEKISFVPFKEIGLKELGIFNGEYYKKILISFGAEKFLQVGKTKFFNINNVTRFSLKKKDNISLSFESF